MKQKLKGFEKIDSIIKEIKIKEKNGEYINRFIDVVNNFENFYTNKNQRKIVIN